MFTFLFSSDWFGTCTMGPQAAPLLSPCVFVYFRGAQKPNAGLGHAQASLGATLNLRICAFLNSLALRVCTSCNTLWLGYRIASNPASLAFQVFVFFQCHHGHRTGGALQRVT